jgi:hypothetical protein
VADIVDDFMSRLVAVSPNLNESLVAMLEAEMRRQWGGHEVYVAKRPGQWRQVVIGQALATGHTVAEAVAAAGVSQRHGYRVLAQRQRKPGR